MLESRASKRTPGIIVRQGPQQALICGAVAQLGERRVRNAKVEGSIPFRSTIQPSQAPDSRPEYRPQGRGEPSERLRTQ